MAAGALLTAAAQAALAAVPDLSGVWRLEAAPHQPLLTSQGKTPPLRPQARALYTRRLADWKAHRNQPSGFAACVPPGTPRVLWSDRPVKVLQTGREVIFVHELRHVQRHIYLDAPPTLGDDPDPTFGGYASGRWSGKVLEAVTVGFNDSTWLDDAGLPHSEQMKVAERIRLIDGGRRMQDVVTVSDPATYLRPWSVRLVFARAPGVALAEDNACVEALLPH